MVTTRQKKAARKSIKRAQTAGQAMSQRERAAAQPQGRGRVKPGTKGEGDYYRVVVRSKEEFVAFGYHDVGRPGHLQRLAGKRASGSWADQAWLISKEDAHVENGRLVADTLSARRVLGLIGPARRVKGDVFKGHPRRNVPERKKPTPAQRRARLANIRKAQKARQP